MKKIILILVVAFLAMVVRFEAKAQNPCTMCSSPGICYQFTLTLSCGAVTYTICYTCHDGNVMDVNIIALNTTCDPNSNEVWDACFDWVFKNQNILCGYVPCDGIHWSTITIYAPGCWDFYWNGNTLSMSMDPNCNGGCQWQYQVCMNPDGSYTYQNPYLISWPNNCPPMNQLPIWGVYQVTGLNYPAWHQIYYCYQGPFGGCIPPY